MYIISSVRLLEIDIPSTTTISAGLTQKFPLDQELRGKKFKAIESFNITQLRTSANGLQVVSAAEAAEVVIYFQVGSLLQLYGVPYNMLNVQDNRGIIRQLANLPIIPEKSYIQITGTSAMVNTRALVVAFHY